MENVVCSCLKCGSELGSFRNSWIGIGNSYFSPAYPHVSYIDGFEATGEAFAKGPDGSAVQNSILQDLACVNCATVIGLRCNDAPEGHLLEKNQIIIRLAEMNVVSKQTGKKAIISVQQKIPLIAKGGKKLATVRRAATVQPTSRAQPPDSLAEYSKQNSTNGIMLPPPTEDLSRKNLAQFAAWAEDAINKQQKEIDRIGGAFTYIEKDMKCFKEFMVEVRAELDATRTTRKMQEDLKKEQIAWLQEDLKELRQGAGEFQHHMKEEKIPGIQNELEKLQQKLDSNNCFSELPNCASLPHMEGSKSLRESVLRIDYKLNEVDKLKTELQKLQKRLTSFEGKRQEESYTFPRNIMDFSGPQDRPSPADGLMDSASTSTRQQPWLMLEAPDDGAARSTTARLVSPTPPGAFPVAITDLDTPHQNIAGRSGGIPCKARPKRPVDELRTSETASAGNSAVIHTIPNSQRPEERLGVIRTASLNPIVVQQWSYTGPKRRQDVEIAFQSFELDYPEFTVQESIELLEEHINNINMQSSRQAQKHGKVSWVENVVGYEGSSKDNPEPSLSKRNCDQVRHSAYVSPYGVATKKRKR